MRADLVLWRHPLLGMGSWWWRHWDGSDGLCCPPPRAWTYTSEQCYYTQEMAAPSKTWNSSEILSDDWRARARLILPSHVMHGASWCFRTFAWIISPSSGWQHKQLPPAVFCHPDDGLSWLPSGTRLKVCVIMCVVLLLTFQTNSYRFSDLNWVFIVVLYCNQVTGLLNNFASTCSIAIQIYIIHRSSFRCLNQQFNRFMYYLPVVKSNWFKYNCTSEPSSPCNYNRNECLKQSKVTPKCCDEPSAKGETDQKQDDVKIKCMWFWLAYCYTSKPFEDTTCSRWFSSLARSNVFSVALLLTERVWGKWLHVCEVQ